MPPSLPRRSVETQYPHPLFIFVFESQTNGGSGKKNGWVRSHLCQVVSVCYSHLVCSTHLVDKRGSLEQERSSLYHLGSVKVLCVFFKRGNLYHLGLVKVLCVCVFFLSLEQHDPVSAMWSRRVLPSCLLHESRGQTWRPRASTNQSLPCRLVQ